MSRKRFGCSCLFVALLLHSNAVAGTLTSPQPPKASRTNVAAIPEEGVDHYDKWLNQDVAYIITPEEKTVFKSLTTDLEREKFVEQFWRRRDPDPSTAFCEFKEKHYRRIAYANQWFQSGKPGWTTDQVRDQRLTLADRFRIVAAGGPSSTQ